MQRTWEFIQTIGAAVISHGDISWVARLAASMQF